MHPSRGGVLGGTSGCHWGKGNTPHIRRGRHGISPGLWRSSRVLWGYPGSSGLWQGNGGWISHRGLLWQGRDYGFMYRGKPGIGKLRLGGLHRGWKPGFHGGKPRNPGGAAKGRTHLLPTVTMPWGRYPVCVDSTSLQADPFSASPAQEALARS